MNERTSQLALAHGFIRMGRFDDALEVLEELEGKRGICRDGFKLSVLAFHKLNRREVLYDFCRRVLVETDFRLPQVWAELLRLYCADGEADIARHLADRAAAEHPAHADVRFECARVYAAIGFLKIAATHMNAAIGQDLDLRRRLANDPDFEELRIYLKRGGS